MDGLNKSFAEKLVAMEQVDSGFRREYERKVRTMLDTKVNTMGRCGLAVMAIVGAGAMIVFGDMVVRGPRLWLTLWWCLTVPGLAAATTWTVLSGWAAATGVLKARLHRAGIVVSGLALAFFVVMAIVLNRIVPVMVGGGEAMRGDLGTQITLWGFFMVNMAGLCVIVASLNGVDFRSRKKLLEIESRLVELGEKLDRLDGKTA